MSEQKRGSVDAWAQPVSAKMLRLLPEVRRLFEQSSNFHRFHFSLTNSNKESDALSIDLKSDFKITPKMLLKLMDEAGVDKMMMCAWCRPKEWILTNEEVYEYVKAAPNRIYGVATVDLDDPVKAVKNSFSKELEHCVKDYGFKALRVPWLWKLPPNDKLYYPLYVKCVELDIPFCTQVGHTGPLMPSETGRPVPYLDEVALTFPQLKIVGGHIGYPWTEEMIGLAWKHKNVYIDTSAYLPKYYPPALLHYMKTYGKEKVLFGSNFPQLSLPQCMQQVTQLNLPNDVLQQFLWKNSYDVFKLHDYPPKAKL